MRHSFKIGVLLATPLMFLAMPAPPAGAVPGPAVVEATAIGAATQASPPCVANGVAIPAGCVSPGPVAGTFTGLVLAGTFADPLNTFACAGTVGTTAAVPFTAYGTIPSGYGTFGPGVLNGLVGTCPAGFATLTTGSFVRVGTVAAVGFTLAFAGGGTAEVSGTLTAVPAAAPLCTGNPACSQVHGTVHTTG